jgi:hypothetical protein
LEVKSKLLIKKEIEVNLPADWISKTANFKSAAGQIFKDTRYFGEKALALTAGLSLVNPRVWEKSLNLPAEEIAVLAHKSDWARPLLAGLGMAAVRYGNDPWFAAVLKASRKFAAYYGPIFAWGDRSFSFVPARRLIPLLVANPDSDFSQWVLQYLEFREDGRHLSEALEAAKHDHAHFIEILGGSARTGAEIKNLARIVSFESIDEWTALLERLKQRPGLKEYQIRSVEESLSMLQLRRDYFTEFNK